MKPSHLLSGAERVPPLSVGLWSVGLCLLLLSSPIAAGEALTAGALRAQPSSGSALERAGLEARAQSVVGTLRVLSLNTYLISTPLGGTAPCLKGRGRLLGRMLRNGTGLQDYDVVMLQEVFNDGARDRIIAELGSKYPYQIFQKPGSAGLEINGGTSLLSKYPLLPVWTYYGIPIYYYAKAWEECDSDDCYAQKGWLHVRIDFNGVPINVFTLHTQANYETPGHSYIATQELQMQQLKAYIDSFPLTNFVADLSSELMVLGGDYNVLAHCDGCDESRSYMAATGTLGMREVWREDFCSLDAQGDEVWARNPQGQNGATKPGFEQRLDMILYDDTRSSSYELRPADVGVNTFYIGYNPSVSCNDDGDFSEPYPTPPAPYVSDHFGVETTFEVYTAANAPGENNQCGVIPNHNCEAACGESECSPARAAYISHFTGLDCFGAEYYYTPYFGSDGVRRSWDGKGCAGTVLRTVTARSYRDWTGLCRTQWPEGNTLSGFVRIYREKYNCGCGEDTCLEIEGSYISHFSNLGCTGKEDYYTPYYGFDGIRRSWDGGGCVGATLRRETHRSWKGSDGQCHDSWPGGNTLDGFVRVYRSCASYGCNYNGVCDPCELIPTCPADCDPESAFCGNLECEYWAGENAYTCPPDCGGY